MKRLLSVGGGFSKPRWGSTVGMGSSLGVPSRFGAYNSPSLKSCLGFQSQPGIVSRGFSSGNSNASLMDKIKEGVKYFSDGTKMLGRNMYAAGGLLKKTWEGNSLSRRERTLLVQTRGDIFRLVPFLVIVIVPFAELSLPVLLVVFPNMLPSTFTTPKQKETTRQRSLKVRTETLKLMKAAMAELTREIKFDKLISKDEFDQFMLKLHEGDYIDNETLVRYGTAFRQEFSLENLTRQQLKPLCKFFGVKAFATTTLLRELLRVKLHNLRLDDQAILREGIENLTLTELEDAAFARGIKTAGCDEARMRKLVLEWIELCNSNVPVYLVLLARSSLLEPAVAKVAIEQPQVQL